MSRVAVELITREIQRQGYKYRPRHKGGQIWICCPFHGESTPSCRVNIDESYGKIGHFYCFGCPARGHWNKLAKATGFAKLSEDDMVEMNGFRRNTKAKRMLESSLKEEESSASSMEEVLLESFMTKTTFDLDFLEMPRWRTISMRLLKKLGARVIIDKHGEENKAAIFLPQFINGRCIGGIKASLEKVKNKLSYVESTGWSTERGLYPYDYVSDLMARKGFRFVVLVEGPRDAIKLIGRGIPALAILGTQKWCDAKRDLLLSLGVDLVILYMDGDKSGRGANKKLKDELKEFVTVKTLSLTALGKELGIEDLDPATVPKKYMADIWYLAKKFKAC